MKSRPKNSPLVGRSDPVAKDYKMYKAGKFWRFAFTMFAGTVIGGSMMTLPNLLPDSGIHVVKAAAGDPLSETRNSDVYNTINGKKVYATITVSGTDDGNGHLAVNKPIELTVDGLPKAIYLEPVTLANTTTGTKSDPVELNIGQVGQTGGFFGFGASKTVSGAGVLTYTFDAATVEKLFGESGGHVAVYVQPLSPNATELQDIEISNDDGEILTPPDKGGDRWR
ncbi:KxYKxGKxW signal peptide domain-containing protein [Lacticaseibacillus camelliae]|nr:KxYKxGKxW signal peptide domain-containing protein [Lacticaseibacillus camelliae]